VGTLRRIYRAFFPATIPLYLELVFYVAIALALAVYGGIL